MVGLSPYSEIPTWKRWFPWGVAAGALAIAAIGFLRPTTDETAIPAQPLRFQIDIGSRDLTTGDTAFNFSPDGQTLAFATNVGTTTQVYLRPTAELLGQVNERFHDHFLEKVKPQGGPT